MRNLFLYLLRYGSFALFLLLEGICVFLLVNYNETQKSIFLNSSGNVNGKVNSFTHRIGEYFEAHSELDSLAEVVRELRTQNLYLNSVVAESDLIDVDLDTQFTYHVARVIQNSTAKSNNFITLNKGSKDGIRPRMGVVSDYGVIGIVRDVSSNYCTVMSVLHRQSQISASIKNSAYFGNLRWVGLNPDLILLEEIPKHASIELGDTIQTSGYSRNFPRGLEIGKIVRIDLEEGANTFTLDIDLFNDMNNLEVVYIIEDLQVEELEELKEKIDYEQ